MSDLLDGAISHYLREIAVHEALKREAEVFSALLFCSIATGVPMWRIIADLAATR